MTMTEAALGPLVVTDREQEIQAEKTVVNLAGERASRVHASGGLNDSKSGMPLPRALRRTS